MTARTRRRGSALLVAAVWVVSAACSSGGSDAASTPTTSTTVAPPSNSTSTTPAANTDYTDYAVFGGAGNNLDAYTSAPPFTRQRVNSAFTPEPPQQSDPNGTDINAQICFFPDGSNRFIAGEDRGQGEGDLQGWGIFKLSGSKVGDFSIEQEAKLVPTYQSSPDNAENYGCGVLSDGRVLTTDIGDQATGAPNGQLIIWYPPFDSEKVKFCKLNVSISTAQSLLVDADDHVLMASARATNEPGATGAGVHELSPPYPSSPDAAGGCGRKDSTGAPLADAIQMRTLIEADGEHGMVTPAGLAFTSDGGLYVSSVFTGVIDEYTRDGKFTRTILQPPADESLGPKPYSTGTPLGIAVGPDGSLYYADIGIVVDEENGVGPGSKTGTVRRITFTDGNPGRPETMGSNLDYPDGIGIFVPKS